MVGKRYKLWNGEGDGEMGKNISVAVHGAGEGDGECG